jgi:hypothetical protein
MESLLIQAGMTTTGVAIVLILWRVLKTASGKKLVSDCCGKKASIGFQVGEMTPLPKMTENPMIKDIVSIPVDSSIVIETK